MREQREFVWFKKWVLERQTLELISKVSCKSVPTLKRKFSVYLNQAPTFLIKQREAVHLLIDGTYFTNDLCLILYQDNDIKYTQLYRFSDRERYEEIVEDLLNLKILGVDLVSVTCDGHRALLKAIKKVYPDVVIQRCLVHIQRMSLIWLTHRPKTQAGKDLRDIVLHLHQIKNPLERDYWIVSLVKWYQANESFLKERSINPLTGRSWYTHKLLRRVIYIIVKALPYMFHYLNDMAIPKSTNGLESYFAHLKNNLNVHRGLSNKNRRNFLRWYLHFKNASRSAFS